MADLTSKLRSTLAGQDNAKIEKFTPLEAFVRKILGEEQAKARRQKLTWSRDEAAKPTDKIVGELNLSMPYQGPFGGKGGFYIQNGRLYRANGTQAKIEDVPDKKHTWTDFKTGMVYEAPSTRQTVIDAIKKFNAQAAANDPMLCAVCFDHRSEDMDERMKHLYFEHPIVFAERLGLQDAVTDIDLDDTDSAVESPMEAEQPPQEEPEKEAPVELKPKKQVFQCCKKRFYSYMNYRSHLAKSKVHQEAFLAEKQARALLDSAAG